MTNVFEGSNGDVGATVDSDAAQELLDEMAAQRREACTCSNTLRSIGECPLHGPDAAEEVTTGPPPLDEKAAEQDRRSVEIMNAAFSRWRDMGPVTITLPNPCDAFILMCLIQLAYRHPTQPFSQVAEDIGRQLQDAVCDREDIHQLAEAGWNVERDR